MQSEDFQHFLDCDAVRKLIGGTRPVNRSSVYRLVARGLWPKPVHPTPGISRWIASECRDALAKIVEARHV
jgi:predicted DNA-binding transcriptional regulator AlpA